jgi:hypothetical protein
MRFSPFFLKLQFGIYLLRASDCAQMIASHADDGAGNAQYRRRQGDDFQLVCQQTQVSSRGAHALSSVFIEYSPHQSMNPTSGKYPLMIGIGTAFFGSTTAAWPMPMMNGCGGQRTHTTTFIWALWWMANSQV